MVRQDLIQKCNSYLGRLVYEVKSANAGGAFDINKYSEDFFVPILSILYDCPDLKNLNVIETNFPAVDLGSLKSRLCFQITSDPGSEKVTTTLQKFMHHNLEKQFDTVYMFIITERQNKYTSAVLADTINLLPVKFDTKTHIIDYRNISEALNTISVEKLAAIHEVLKREFTDRDRHLHFREEFEKFVAFGKSKLEVEKATKKYIPSIFVETSDAKEYVRYFANPLFFYRKTDEKISSINTSYLNSCLTSASIPSINFDALALANSTKPTSLPELKLRNAVQLQGLDQLLKLVEPFSYHGRRESRYEPDGTHDGAWDIFRVRIQNASSTLYRASEESTEFIKLTEAKIFLVTGMAGQGKTNFLCDLIENQFARFAIPSIFIPARNLNAYAAPDRIFRFLIDNRYAPKVDHIHGFFEILNQIAAENQKPFIIAIDGINEVTQLSEFNDELKSFLNALCQYEYLKTIITCRSEFFEQRFSTMLHEPFAQSIHHVKDLRSKMSRSNKKQLLFNYFRHFSIGLALGPKARGFLQNDMLLLRIFCENRAGQQHGFIPAIYKGDLFEEYLRMKINDFPRELRPLVLPTLYKMVGRMLEKDEYATQPIKNLSVEEARVLDRLIADDIILRREVPGTGLALADEENISFTYDELRDFLIAHYIVADLSSRDEKLLEALFERLPTLPIYEGVFRYSYILSRKFSSSRVLLLCESSPQFIRHYAKNLSIIPPELQTPEDITRVNQILSSSDTLDEIVIVVNFLLHARQSTELLNIKILTDHINSLDDESCKRFFSILYSDFPGDYRNAWRDKVDAQFRDLPVQKETGLLAISDNVLLYLLQLSGFAGREAREAFYGHMQKLVKAGRGREVSDAAKLAKSANIIRSVAEVERSV